MGGQPLIAEQWVNFDYEVSSIGARNVDGDIAIYPLSRNVHEDGILRTSRSPVDDARHSAESAPKSMCTACLSHLDYVGVLALELFVLRVTICSPTSSHRACTTPATGPSRARKPASLKTTCAPLMNLPLGSTASKGHAGMVNLIGEIPESARATTRMSVSCTIMERTPRAGPQARAHVTVLADTAEHARRACRHN